MRIDLETIEKVAHLARLEVKEEEKQGLLDDMNKILDFMDKLNEVDTESVEPLVYMNEEFNVFRSDEVIKTISRTDGLLNAPSHDDRYFRVAKVINK